jgi:hypothetical protein
MAIYLGESLGATSFNTLLFTLASGVKNKIYTNMNIVILYVYLSSKLNYGFQRTKVSGIECHFGD